MSFERLPFAYVATLIHELAHNAPSDDSRLGRVYEHEEMDAAAGELGSSGFDQYVREAARRTRIQTVSNLRLSQRPLERGGDARGRWKRYSAVGTPTSHRQRDR